MAFPKPMTQTIIKSALVKEPGAETDSVVEIVAKAGIFWSNDFEI